MTALFLATSKKPLPGELITSNSSEGLRIVIFPETRLLIRKSWLARTPKYPVSAGTFKDFAWPSYSLLSRLRIVTEKSFSILSY